MLKKLGLGFVAYALATSAAQAVAVVSWDVVDTVENNKYVGWGETYSYAHQLADDELGPDGTLTALEGGQLEIFFGQDGVPDFISEDSFQVAGGVFPEAPESLILLIENQLAHNGSISFGSFTVGNIMGQAIGEINQTGRLDVSIISLMGDFMVQTSTLRLNVEPKEYASVPEPGVLMLLGLGLVGLRVARPKAA